MLARDVSMQELPPLRDLNEEVLPHVNSLSRGDIEHLHRHSARFRVVDCEGEIAGFLIGFLPAADYASVNLRWFKEHYSNFVYVDRVIVAPNWRRRGVARLLYEDLEVYCRQNALDSITCEVHTDPPNPGSLVFHETMGFREVEVMTTAGKSVSLLRKSLSG